MRRWLPALGFVLLTATCTADEKPQPYRLGSIDMRQRLLWGAEVREPEGQGLAFGGQDQEAEDGNPHTRILVNGEWVAIHEELRQKNPLQTLRQPILDVAQQVKKLSARTRFIYFKGLTEEEESALQRKELQPLAKELHVALAKATAGIPPQPNDGYVPDQSRYAFSHLMQARQNLPNFEGPITPEVISKLHQCEIRLSMAAEAFDAEPAPRALDCGKPSREKAKPYQPAKSLVYDPDTGLYVLFGGDHFDYLTNDLWVFEPKGKRWMQKHPKAAPAPRANHRLEPMGDGILRLSGGYTYTSSTDYVGGQYVDLNDGDWLYDINKNEWTPAEGNKNSLVAADQRVYRTGAFHPDYFLQGERPNAAKFEAWLKELPANEWVATNPEYRPELNRDWGVARIDPHRDLMLRWSGGHSAHGGTDVPHFHFSTNRWELAFPVEFPLGQLYDNTEYPYGLNFNLRPWMTGHTYQNYEYDLVSRKMIETGHEHHFHVYDPDLADWIGRGEKAKVMQYGSCFYTLTLTSTPSGIICWDANGRIHRYENEQWVEMKLTGEELPGAPVDHSSICYDSTRDRVLILNSLGYGKEYGGQIWSVDLKSGEVKTLSPECMTFGPRFAAIDKCCYDPVNDLLLVGTYLTGAGSQTPTPAYDCKNNRWITLDLKYKFHPHYDDVRREFPHQRSDGLMFDPQRKLIWGVDTNGQVYVLRLDLESANPQPITALKPAR